MDRSKKYKCVKEFRSIYEYTGNMSDRVNINYVVFNIFKPCFQESLNNQLPDEIQCMQDMMYNWLCMLEFKSECYSRNDGYLYKHRKIIPSTSSEEKEKKGVIIRDLMNISDLSDSMLNERMKFNLLYKYTGNEDDYVDFNHITFSLDIACRQTKSDLRKWLVTRCIDDSPIIGSKSLLIEDTTYTFPTLKKYRTIPNMK